MSNHEENKSKQARDNSCCERICRLYGICGLESKCMDSHSVSHFGIKKLNEHNKS